MTFTIPQPMSLSNATNINNHIYSNINSNNIANNNTTTTASTTTNSKFGHNVNNSLPSQYKHSNNYHLDNINNDDEVNNVIVIDHQQQPNKKKRERDIELQLMSGNYYVPYLY